jgi:hypothetical protein
MKMIALALIALSAIASVHAAIQSDLIANLPGKNMTVSFFEIPQAFILLSYNILQDMAFLPLLNTLAT